MIAHYNFCQIHELVARYACDGGRHNIPRVDKFKIFSGESC
jgi:hypothetical protein